LTHVIAPWPHLIITSVDWVPASLLRIQISALVPGNAPSMYTALKSRRASMACSRAQAGVAMRSNTVIARTTSSIAAAAVAHRVLWLVMIVLQVWRLV